MALSTDELEAHLQAVARACPDPVAGLFGPRSMSWRIARESGLFLGGGRAALLQLAHPWVAQAVAHHSATRTDPLGRLTRTFRHVHAMVFGDLDTALRTARGVHKIHTRITGTLDHATGAFPQGSPYEANQTEALAWVHATLIDSAVRVHDLLLPGLSYTEKDTYYQESKRFAALFGIPPGSLPDRWEHFQTYCTAMQSSGALAVGPACQELAGFLLAPRGGPLDPLLPGFRVFTAALLPASLREPLGFHYSPQDERWFSRACHALRVLYPRVPRRLRDVPDYTEARRRLQGRPARDRLGRALQASLFHAMVPPPEGHGHRGIGAAPLMQHVRNVLGVVRGSDRP
ncbi:MAG: DUF2236 domain-containing protein [Deltaproteobacteria bacterium]|nr:DUF2236 domain-containing protein [Deltaproteobacteria bacterium]